MARIFCLFVEFLWICEAVEQKHVLADSLVPARKCSASGCRCTEVMANCKNLNLTEIPRDLPRDIQQLNVAGNSLGRLRKLTLKGYNQIKTLILDDNGLRDLPERLFFKLEMLEDLSLKNNRFGKVPSGSLLHTGNLRKLFLSSNQLFHIGTQDFKKLSKLKQLWLDDNRLKDVPYKALSNVLELDVLNLGGNFIKSIGTFPPHALSNLVYLLLENNFIRSIDRRSFINLQSLKVLELHNNRLEKVPQALSLLKNVEEISLSGNRIRFISNNTFRNNRGLRVVNLDGNPLYSVEVEAFNDLPNLNRIILANLKNQEKFVNLSRSNGIEKLEIDRSKLSSIPNDMCSNIPRLISLVIKSSQLESVPNLTSCLRLVKLDLSYGHLQNIGDNHFGNQRKIVAIHLSNNRISAINMNTFRGLENLQLLDLEKNNIKFIHPEAFIPTPRLIDLNLGNNMFRMMPTDGLESLRFLKVHNNPELKTFPSHQSFPSVQKLILSYAYHCCEFRTRPPYKYHNGTESAITSDGRHKIKETVVWLKDSANINMDMWRTGKQNVSSGLGSNDSNGMELANEFWKTFGKTSELAPEELDSIRANERNILNQAEEENEQVTHWVLSDYDVECLPRPGPFLPCDDLFGWWTLRCGVWIVFLLALLGNGAVVIVLCFSRTKMDVPRYLVCNLAVADFFMSIYLGFLALVDASTLGEFKSYAVRWQFSAGCQMAGFLGVLSSELSVFTLSVITLERHYAITHAMHLNKRLCLRHASYIMSGGWTFAVVLATLPLGGVSDYRKFAICLPFETGDKVSLGYVVFLVLVNGVAFTILTGCYLKMYCSIRGSQAWNSNDSRIAKRMALLVFTDFFCWAPIAFFSLFAVAGTNIVSTEGAKILTIFVLPFNSCANPFLYAITTKQFKKDCVVICKRIEESRVTRGIGRRRNSSNFSNRHNEQWNSGEDDAVQRNRATTTNGIRRPIPDCTKQLIRTNQVSLCQRPDGRRSKGLDRFKSFFCESQKSVAQLGPKNDDVVVVAATSSPSVRQKRKPNRFASSISSENLSSSRTDSWRNSIPLRFLDRTLMNAAFVACRSGGHDLCHRKSSQESDMSSKLDSSSLATTSTFRISRSSISSSTEGHAFGNVVTPQSSQSLKGDKMPAHITHSDSSSSSSKGVQERRPPAVSSIVGPNLGEPIKSSLRKKPRLCRQVAVVEEAKTVSSSSSPPMSPLVTATHPEKSSDPDNRAGYRHRSGVYATTPSHWSSTTDNGTSSRRFNNRTSTNADVYPSNLTMATSSSSKLPVLPEGLSKSDDGHSTD
ncbi:LGR4 (predicted) [Pycnogonum litorale]